MQTLRLVSTTTKKGDGGPEGPPTTTMKTTTTTPTRNERGRITGIYAYLMDKGELGDAIADELVRQGETSVNRGKIDPLDSVLLHSQTCATFAIINDEGVGGHETEDHVRVWFTYGEMGLYMHDILIPSDALIEASTAEPVDLADFIRTFGDRLDSNHELWANWHFNN